MSAPGDRKGMGIEYAPTGRAGCRAACHNPIEKDELRIWVDAVMDNEVTGEKKDIKKYYHADCFSKCDWTKKKIKSAGQFQGLNEITEEDRKWILKRYFKHRVDHENNKAGLLSLKKEFSKLNVKELLIEFQKRDLVSPDWRKKKVLQDRLQEYLEKDCAKWYDLLVIGYCREIEREIMKCNVPIYLFNIVKTYYPPDSIYKLGQEKQKKTKKKRKRRY